MGVQGHSGGLALLWKNSGGCKIIKATRNFIDFEVENRQVGRWRYTDFYGYPERQRRQDSWESLKNLAGESALPWCVIGDFNDMLYEDEKRRGRKQPYNLLMGFMETLNVCGLKDLGYVGEKYTWEKSRRRHNWIQERLDRGMATDSWCNLFPMAEVQVIEVTTSDHLPLLLQINKQVYAPKERKFKFENVWIWERECKNIVKNGWEVAGGSDIVEKIRVYGVRLQEWGGGTHTKYRLHVQECRRLLRNLRSRRDEAGITRYNEVREEYLKLLNGRRYIGNNEPNNIGLGRGIRILSFFTGLHPVEKRIIELIVLKMQVGCGKEQMRQFGM